MLAKNLLALLGALRTVSIDSDTQRYFLLPLGNKLEALREKNLPSEQDWQAIQIDLEFILTQNPILAQRCQQLLSQWQSLTVEELKTLLPSVELRQQLQSVAVLTLGFRPAPLRLEPNQEVENIVVEVATIILKSNDVTKMANQLLPTVDTEEKPEHSLPPIKSGSNYV
jgi:hypothetical protein